MSPIVIRLPFGRKGGDEGRPRAEAATDAVTPVTGDGAEEAPTAAVALPPPASSTAEPAVPEPASYVSTGPGPEVEPAREAEPEPAPEPELEAEPLPTAAPAYPASREQVPPPPAGPTMAEHLADLARYRNVVLAWIAEDGYPMNVAAAVEVSPDKGTLRFSNPVALGIPAGARVAITGSHVAPVPGGGIEERRHLTVWGTAVPRPRGRFLVTPDRAWAWDDEALPLPALYERDLPKARRFYERLSAARGVTVRPRMPTGLLLVRATRAPFLSATFVPVLLGIAIAARTGSFDLVSSLLTLLAASAVHLGLNAANDVFDTMLGADDANPTPTRFSGGSRVIQNSLVTTRGLSGISAACYALAAVMGLVLLWQRGSSALLAIFVVGLFISLAYTMPPFKLVYRGLGEVATAIGFGPVMLLGAYVVQTRGPISVEAVVASIPVGLLVALILYVNEIPDRRGDAKVGKRTLPVRWPRDAVIRAFDVVAASSFIVVVLGVVAAALPFTTLLVVVAAPLALVVHDGLVSFYDAPYSLMPTMGANIRMHLVFGLLMLAGYVLAIADKVALGKSPFLW
jgi:1,4-dihydroxy-2-naphthoate polyprenyltransferase